MNFWVCLVLVVLATSCSSNNSRFDKAEVCSNQAIKYLKNPRNKNKQSLSNPELQKAVAATKKSMQLCYEDFRNRSGVDEFNTCLVVGVDEGGKEEFFNFSTQEVEVDERFVNCATAVTRSVPYSNFGSNYILIQAYQFYRN